MRVKNHKDFACMDYVQNKQSKDMRKLGQIVYKLDDDGDESIGVIIQIHGDGDYRTDMFGNCCFDEVKLATIKEIKRLRPKLIKSI